MHAARYIIAGALALVLAGCAPKRIDPPLYTYETPRAVSESARLHALEVGGTTFAVADTRSMEPLLRGGDLLVVSPVQFGSLRVGHVVTYRAGWTPPGAPPVTHRIVAVDNGGLLMSGDNSPRSEPKHRVTAETLVGLVAGIYRLRK